LYWNIGVPTTANYIGEFLLFTGSFVKNPLIVLLGATSMILSGAYGIWLYGRITGGVPTLNF
jgi:NADH:ubiquinone oxidoreductase subunit 4 (subunit M)